MEERLLQMMLVLSAPGRFAVLGMPAAHAQMPSANGAEAPLRVKG
jgi:hypothetical protein